MKIYIVLRKDDRDPIDFVTTDKEEAEKFRKKRQDYIMREYEIKNTNYPFE